MFVRCEGPCFTLGSEPYFAEGVNCYFLGFCSDSTRESSLPAAKRLGANTVRAWAFLDVEQRTIGSPAFQYCEDGEIKANDGPEGLARLDHLIWLAEQTGLKLILPFTNYWDDFGGMAAYLRWLGLPETDRSAFYNSPATRVAYKAWVERLLTRRNRLTGRLYLEEPSVLAWELANEPRSEAKRGGGLLIEWVHEMSEYVKTLDANHLVASGDEGFFSRMSLTHLYDGRYGVDFEAILTLPSIDFGTFHMYPQHWGEADPDSFARRWISDHIRAGNRAGKPVLLEEFALERDENTVRATATRNLPCSVWTRQVREEGGAGALVWMLGSEAEDAVHFRDRYTFFPDELRANSSPVSQTQGNFHHSTGI